MKVAIWGSYNFGNFGDDLMAVMLAKHLISLGVQPIVYRLDSSISDYYSIESSLSINELLDGAKFCLIGGGNFLQAFPSLELEWKEFLRGVYKYSMPVHMISVGGDGSGLEMKPTRYQKKILESSSIKQSTVRLKSDVDFLSQYKKKAFFYPDVVLSTSLFWPAIQKTTGKDFKRLRVGINLARGNKVRLFYNILSLISNSAEVEFFFFSTHLPNYSLDYEFLPSSDLRNIHSVTYTNLDSLVECLSSMDLLVSSKLHLGVAALAQKVPFYSLGGSAKTQAFLKELGCEFAVLPDSKFEYVKLAYRLSSRDNIIRLCHRYKFDAILPWIEMSRGHLKFIEDIVREYS